MKTIELGNKVKDKITGFTGIAVTKCIYLNGCIQYSIQPSVDEKGEIPEGVWIDEQQLEIMEEKEEKSNIPDGLRSESQISEDNARKRNNGGGFREHPLTE